MLLRHHSDRDTAKQRTDDRRMSQRVTGDPSNTRLGALNSASK